MAGSADAVLRVGGVGVVMLVLVKAAANLFDDIGSA